MKKNNFLMLMALVLLLGCRQESLLVENAKAEEVVQQGNIHNRFSSSFVSIKTLKTQLKNSLVKSSVDALVEKSKKNSTDILLYEKVYDAANGVTTFTLPLADYSTQSPFMLKHIITIENGVEKSGFLKIIPNSAPIGNRSTLSDFSGTIQILGENLKVFSQSEYLNGNLLSPQSNTPSTVSSKFDCWNQTVITVYNCSNGGNHPPGVSCTPPDVNDGYYQISTKMVCGEAPNYLQAPPGNPTISNGGGFSPLHKVFTNPNFLYTSYITEPNHLYLLNHAAYWASLASDPLTNDEVNTLNEKIGMFVNNDSIFGLIDDYYTKVYSSGTNYLQGVYNDSKINNLLKYLFDTPTQKNADFVKWGIQFLAQNPTVSWDQFQNWFLTNTSSGFLEQVTLENPATILNYETLSSPNFKMRKIDQIKYPNFTTVVKNLKSEIQNNPTTLNRLVELTGLTESQVLGSLTFGQGPSIRLVPNLTGPSGPNYGNFNPADPTFINIKLEFVLGLEQASLSSTRHATAFLLAVTILHEFIHFGNYISGYDTNGNEMGNIFEYETYGFTITHLNAGYYLIQLK